MTVSPARTYRKLFQDSIVVDIPLDAGVTADLGVAIKHTRAKRIQSIYQHFPSLQKEKAPHPADNPEDSAAALDKDDDEQDEKDKKLLKKKRPKDETLPQREQYGSVMDYLEAKYVRGVMLGDEIADDDEAEDDKESVYSEDSWLDDSLLKRDVAEQVLSHSTQTKVGAENEDEDDFFVNVGNLEVEDNGLMNYDPAEDDKAAKKAKKRKRSDTGHTKSNNSAKGGASDGPTPKKKKSDSSSKLVASKKETSSDKAEPNGVKKGDSDQLVALKQQLDEQEATLKEMSDRIVAEIKAIPKEDLPRKKKTIKVSISVPEGKKVGDVITFSNPHIPGQRLKVQVPKDKGPGDTFAVSMPAPEVTDESDGNKFTREVQELVADYATFYDNYCQVLSDYHQADPDQKGKFPLKARRMAKFDEIVKLFPSNLVTPLDAAYMKKIVRRARQNKKKRKEAGDDEQASIAASTVATAATTTLATAKAPTTAAKAKPTAKPDVKSLPKAPKHKLLKAVKPAANAMEPVKAVKPATAKPAVTKTKEIVLPSLGRVFPERELKHDEFEHMTNH